MASRYAGSASWPRFLLLAMVPRHTGQASLSAFEVNAWGKSRKVKLRQEMLRG